MATKAAEKLRQDLNKRTIDELLEEFGGRMPKNHESMGRDGLIKKLIRRKTRKGASRRDGFSIERWHKILKRR